MFPQRATDSRRQLTLLRDLELNAVEMQTSQREFGIASSDLA
jgi:hypothetical protein